MTLPDGHHWYHCIRLDGETVTPGTREPNAWELMRMPERMDGIDVLDVGASDGYFSFEAERRGAKRVVAIDQYSSPTHGGTGPDFARSSLKNFQFCHEALHSHVERKTGSIYDIPNMNLGLFDSVFFIQVLYHLEDMLAALRIIRSVTWRVCYFETLAIEGDQPVAFFNRPLKVADETTFWIPTTECTAQIVQWAGFKILEHPVIRVVPEGVRVVYHLFV